MQKRCFTLLTTHWDILWIFCPCWPCFWKWPYKYFGLKWNTSQLLSNPLPIWIKFSSNSVIVGKYIYISNLSTRQLKDCVNDHLWTNPLPQKYQYLRSNKQTTCLKKLGWISCTVIPHCLSSKRSTLTRAVAACLDMQYTPIPGNVTWPKLQQVRQHENIRYYKTTAFIYKFIARGAKSGWIVIVRNWQNIQIPKIATEGEKMFWSEYKIAGY